MSDFLRSLKQTFREAQRWWVVLGRTAADRYPTLIYRTWLDEAKTKPVYVAEVLFASPGWSVIGQGSTPSRAERDARKALAFVLKDASDREEVAAAAFGPGDVVLIALRDGELSINHVHPATKET
jgi:hypothetical protein